MRQGGADRDFGKLSLLAASIALGYGLLNIKPLGIDSTRSILTQIAGLLAIVSGFSILWSP